ncbi:MAG: methyltransferase [Succinivibrionaceae bacterium]
MTIKNYNDISAVDALKKAQEYAVAPFIFQTIISMKRFGIFKMLSEVPFGTSFSKKEIAKECNISEYASSILVDMAVTADILIEKDEKYFLSKVGFYLANDRMTNVNLDFSNDVCYLGLAELTSSLQKTTPEGLKVFTKEHDTIYPFLSSLPKDAKESWFAFDHFYSDHVFSTALEKIFAIKQFKHINDIGGNTGKFAIEATTYNKDVKVTIIDLPQQCVLAKDNSVKHGLADRIDTYGVNILDKGVTLPNDADLWWMSQFLDCFSEDQIKDILTLVYSSMKDTDTLIINEIFGDRQKNDIASMIVDANSLYFTALANGKSRFYHAREFLRIVEKVGFKVNQQIDHVGVGHTLLFLSK